MHFLFQAEDGIRDYKVTGVQTCALPISRARKRLFVAVVVAGVLSFLVSLWMTRVAQPWAFFGMPTRIWEFALGGALALVLNGNSGRRTSASTVLQAVGLVMKIGRAHV